MIKKILGNSYLNVKIRFIYFIRKYFLSGYFSLNLLDQKLEKYVNYNDGFYVELGANDGVSQSNSLYFELRRGWQGILVEPVPHNYLSCVNYRNKNNKIFCNACVSFKNKKKYVDIKYANLMTVSSNLKLDKINKQNHLIKARKYLLKNNETSIDFGARAITLNKILQISKAPKIIDFLSLDVEGAELEVLKGIDFKKYKFKFILIEARNFKKIKHYLQRYEYFFLERFSKKDYLFKLNLK